MTNGQKILVGLVILVVVGVVAGAVVWQWPAISGAGKVAVAKVAPPAPTAIIAKAVAMAAGQNSTPTAMPTSTPTSMPTKCVQTSAPTVGIGMAAIWDEITCKWLIYQQVITPALTSTSTAMVQPTVSPAMPSATPTQTPTRMSTPSVTASATVTTVVSPTGAILGSSIVTSTVSLTSTNGSSKFGTVAWHAENQADGSVYGEAPIGGLSEESGIVAQVWTDKPVTERWVFYIPPHTVAWLSGHRGGTGWWFNPKWEAAADLQKQANELLVRDGEMKTTFVYLPQDASKFRLLTRMQAAVPTVTVMPTMTQTLAPKPSATANVVAAGKCNIGGESIGPCILEGEVDGKPTVVKLNTGAKYSLAAGGCFSFPSQTALDARWQDHKREYLAKYPAGQAIEK